MKNSESVRALLPHFIEREQRWRTLNRRWWAILWVSVGITGAAVMAVLASAVKPIPVIAFDSKGQPILYDDTSTARHRVDDVRIKYFAQQFIKRFVGINGSNVDQDVADAVNMMTPRCQQIILHGGDFLKRRMKYRDANLRSVFQQFNFRIAPYNPEAMDAKIYVKAWGRMDFRARSGEVEGDGPKGITQFFLSALVLQRQPLTIDNISGLLVDSIETYYFDTEESLKVHILKSQS